ncbi:hypothetical protein F8S13_25325 [Chloroflexia bacterium SDU3-3]|nr:hypothetical protein F8S13_25325 [Chloroflexia bacterium SDU3-3]
MDFLRRLFGGAPAGGSADGAIHLYVRCSRCGSPVHVRVDPRNDLVPEYGDDDIAAEYVLHKEIMDSKCFRIMRAELRYDRARRETSRSLEGGEFITREEFDQLRSA